MGRAEDIFQKLKTLQEDAIDEFIINHQTEELFLDFKRANPSGNGKGTAMHHDDRKNLAKAISGFGNSEGGVILWGVDCARDVEIGDVAKAKVRIENVRRFLSWIENSVSGCTLPAHKTVQSTIIGEKDDETGYIATLIPKSNFAPLMASDSKYYIRAGSSTQNAPPSVLAGMFGRRPQPYIFVDFVSRSFKVYQNTLEITFMIQAINDSNFIARELYFTCNVIERACEKFGLHFSPSDGMQVMSYIPNHYSSVSSDDFKLPPQGKINLATISIKIDPPVTNSFVFEGVVGAGNSLPKNFRLRIEKDALRRLVDDAITSRLDIERGSEYQNFFLEQFFKNLEISV
ncbi:MAG: helix-turn-helix domain-containing protein [Alphaproteobacteria bacterium]